MVGNNKRNRSRSLHLCGRDFRLAAGTMLVAMLLQSPCVAQSASPPAESSHSSDRENLLHQLRSRDAAVRGNAACETGKLGADGAFAVPALIDMLRDEQGFLAGDINGHDIYSTPAEQAAAALVKIGAPAVEALMVAARDRRASVRSRAVYALARIGDPRAVDTLARAMRDRNRKVRHTAAIYIHQTDDKLLDALIRALDDPDESVRWEASKHMQSYADHPRALQPMIDALGNNTSDVQSYVLIALSKLGDSAATPAIVRLLEDPSAAGTVRNSAARALGSATDEASFAALMRASDDANWSIRSGALQALGSRRDPRAVPRLIASLDNENMTERLIAAQSLGEIGDSRAVEPLKARLEDPQPAVRKTVAAALVQIKQ